ncbi:MAG: DUF2142 domain-containing protein [Lachnospiraceae bacterium]|nr:DUF2142 domain-containing protein [Lachnospiraceae bacterium]
MKQKLKISGPWIMVLLVAVLGGWHFLETRRGVAASGDFWLCDLYIGLLVAAAAFLAVFGALFLWPCSEGKVRWNSSWWKRVRVEVCAFLAVLVLGGMYMVVLPPLSAPDEIAHFASAYAISNQMMGMERTDEYGFVLMRKEDEFLQNVEQVSGDEVRTSLGRTLTEDTWQKIYDRAFPIFVEDEQKVMVSSVNGQNHTTPVSYLAPAIGITLGRLLGVNCIVLAFLGRFFNLLFYAGMVYGAVKVLPFGKMVLFGVSVLPMALHLAASYSYDAFLMATCFFFGSYCLHLAYAKPMVEIKDIVLLAVLAAAFGPCKMVYAVMMGFALLIPVKKFGDWKKWTVSAAAVLVAFGAAMILVNRATITNYAVSTDTYVEWAAEPAYSFSWILHNPLNFARVMYDSLVHLGDEWTLQLFGSMLGNLDPVLSVPFWVVGAMAVCLVLLSLRNAGEPLYMKGWQKAWVCFLAVGCLLGLMTAMLIAWTPLSSQVVEGVQGRYLLPVIPFVFMCLKSDRVVRTGGSDETLVFYMCALNCYVLLRVFSIVSLRL